MAIRLLKQINRRVKGVTYYKWRIGELPPGLLHELGWQPGQELTAETREGKLILTPKP